MSEIASLFYETDLAPKWIKQSDRQTVTIDSNPIPLIQSLQNFIELPWPLDDRWAYNKAIAFIGDDSQEISQFQFSHSKHEKDFFGTKISKAPKGTTMLKVKQDVRIYQQISENETLFYEISDVDFQSSSPQYIQNRS